MGYGETRSSKSQEIGRVKYVELTNHGKLVAEALNELVHDLRASDIPRKRILITLTRKKHTAIQKVGTVKQEVETDASISSGEAIRFNRRLAPYYRELNTVWSTIKHPAQ